MTFLESPRFLRHVLWADAASGAATAVLQLTAGGALANLLGLPVGLLTGSALLLIVYVAAAAWLANCEPVPRAGVTWLMVGNWLWVGGCLALLFTGAAATTLGQAYLAIQAVAVAVLAELQWLGLRRRSNVPGWA